MSHTIVIRFPSDLFKKVQKTARVQKKNRSVIIREALEDFFSRTGPSAEKDPYQTLLSLMPLEGSGISDLASRSEEYLRKKFHARSRSH